MLGNRFSIRQAISFGWSKSFEHIILLLKMAFTMMVVEIVLLIGLLPLSVLLYVTRDSYISLLPITLLFAYLIAAVLLLVGMIRLGVLRVLLDIYERNASTVQRLFSAFPLTFNYIGAAILFNLIFLPLVFVMGGVNLLLPTSAAFIGGIVGALAIAALKARLGFYMYPLVDQKTGPLVSLKTSWHITKGSTIKIMIFEFLLALIPVVLGMIAAFNLMGAIGALSRHWYAAAVLPAALFAIALFFLMLIVPMIMLANVYVYKQLSRAFRHEHDYTHEDRHVHDER